MKQTVSKLILFLALASAVFGTSRFFEILGQTQALAYSAIIDPKDHAREIIEKYTGEKYFLGDCETKQLFESSDENIDLACEILEGGLK